MNLRKSWISRRNVLRLAPVLLTIVIGALSLAPSFAQTGHGIDLKWTASSSVGVAGQKVYRGTVTGGPYTLLTTTPLAPTILTYTDPIVDGNKYFYVVTAISQGPIVIESTFSNEVSATAPGPQPNPPTALVATPQ